MELHRVTWGYICMATQGYIRLYTGLHKTAKGLHGATQGYVGLHRVT